MTIAAYIHAQSSNVESIMRLPHCKLLKLVDKLYDDATELVTPNTPARYGRFLLLAHQSFLSASSLILQAQPYDAGPITRRAIEIARVCLATKYDKRIEEKWVAFDKRKQRWLARQHGGKPVRLPPFQYDYQGQESFMKDLNEQHGILSDGFAHFTPEYYASQHWRTNKIDDKHSTLELDYFISDQKTIEGEIILLADTHAQILNVIDHCMDRVLSANIKWSEDVTKLYQTGQRFGRLFAQRWDVTDAKPRKG